MTIKDLITEAKKIAVPRDAGEGFISGEVGSVILTNNGKIFKGVSIDCPCGIGFCGEHSAVAAMITDRESEIDLIVAIDNNGKILPPCGRCRELMYQVNKKNLDTTIILSEETTIKLKQLLPLRWQEEYH